MYKVPNSVLEQIVNHLSSLSTKVSKTNTAEIIAENQAIIKLINDNYLEVKTS